MNLYKETKSYMMFKFSHNVRTSLSYMIPFCDDLKEKIMSEVGVLEKDMNESFQIMQQCNSEIQNLVTELTTLMDLKGNRVKLKNETFDLVNLIDNCIMIQQKIRLRDKKEVVLNIDIDRNSFPGYVKSDSFRLSQIFSNLLSNSFKYTDSGLIEIFAGYNNEDETFTLRIKDQGCGIRKDKLEEIFHPYACCNEDDNKKPSINLGLSITKELCNLFEGTLSIDSDGIGQGTTSQFECKLEESIQISPIEEDVTEEIDFNNFKCLSILVVEDNPLCVKVMVHLLMVKNPFKHIQFAKNGVEALDLIKTQHFDIIFMDMPVMDGMECTRKLREMGVTTWISAVTATSESQKIKFCKDKMNSILSKPVRLKDIREVLRKCIVIRILTPFSPTKNPEENYACEINNLIKTPVAKKIIDKRELSEKKDDEKRVYAMFKDNLIKAILGFCFVWLIGFYLQMPEIYKLLYSYFPLKMLPIVLDITISKEWGVLSHVISGYCGSVYFYFHFGHRIFSLTFFNICLFILDCCLFSKRRFLIFVYSLIAITTSVYMDNINYEGYIKFNEQEFRIIYILSKVMLIATTVRVTLRSIEMDNKEETELIKIVNTLNTEKNEQNQICAKISHDLRTPITGFASFLDNVKVMLKDRYDIVDFEDNTFEELMNCVHNIRQLTNNLVYLYKLKHNKVQCNPVISNFRKMFHEIVEYQNTIMNESTVDVSFSVEDNVPKVGKFDKDLAGEIFNKIVSNALKYTTKNDSSGKITINCYVGNKKDFHVVVKDNGKGIEKDKMKGIFNPLTYLYSTESKKPSASLGMLICKELSKFIGGDIILSSEGKNKGTTSHFFFPYSDVTDEDLKSQSLLVYLENNTDVYRKRGEEDEINSEEIMINPKPIVVNEMSLKEEKVEEEKVKKDLTIGKTTKEDEENLLNDNNISILAVDDDPLIVKVFKNWLGKRLKLKNFSIASNGVKVLQLIQKNNYDLLFLDFYLKDMNAFQIIQKINDYHLASNTEKRLNIVLITGANFNETDVQNIQKFGILKVLTKPINFHSFVKCINMTIAVNTQDNIN